MHQTLPFGPIHISLPDLVNRGNKSNSDSDSASDSESESDGEDEYEHTEIIAEEADDTVVDQS